MAKTPRYLWGVTKADHFQFIPSDPPKAKAGRMYFSSDNNTFRFCEDGTHFMLIRDILHN